ncbi:tetratricopeptide repeat protein [Cryomorphaceae bacterium 1068]|nr:tetratricopeptide repeat protein [Cryomorphaceae bacterium 1068]
MKPSFFLVLLLFTTTLVAQSHRDSLRMVWNDASQADTSRLNALDELFEDLIDTDPDSAIYYSNLQYDFAEVRGLKEEKAKALNNIGLANDEKGELEKALEQFQKAHDLYEEVGNRKGMGEALKSIGSVYWTKGEYAVSINYNVKSKDIAVEIGDREMEAGCLRSMSYSYFNQGQFATSTQLVMESLDISEEINDDFGVAWCINALGVIYSTQGNEEKALEYYIRGLEMNEEAKDTISISFSLRNIGSSLLEMGDDEKALEYFERCLVLDKAMTAKRSLSITLSAMGRLSQNQGNFELALDYYNQSQDLAEELKNRDMVKDRLETIGNLHLEMGNLDLGVLNCKKSYDIAMEIGSIEGLMDACECLHKGYKAKGDFAAALKYHEEFLVYDDSMNVAALGEDLQQMEFANLMKEDSLRSETENIRVQLAHEIEVSEKERSRNLFMAGGIILFLLAIGLFTRNRHVKKSRDTISHEKDRSENLLLSMLPEEIAEELKENGRAEARDFDIVSILFTDFKGFTAASEKMSAQDLVAELNTCFEAFDRIVDKYGIEKIKTIGDAYMCAGGLPLPDETSVKKTVIAGLEMQAFMKKRKAQRDSAGKPAFDMRVGIHTGPVVAGIVGFKRFQYDIWGDTVNLASRMESSGEVGKVNISQATYDHLKDEPDFSFESRGKIDARGKGKVEMYFVKEA